MKFVQKILFVVLTVLLVVSPAYAGMLDDLGAGSANSASSKSSGPSVLLHHCATKLDTTIALKIQQPQQYQEAFAELGFSADLFDPLVQYGLDESSCLNVVGGRAAANAKWELRVAMNVVTEKSIPYAALVMSSFRKPKEVTTLVGVSVVMTVVDLDSGKTITTVTGDAKGDDTATGVQLLANAPAPLSGAPSQNQVTQVAGSAFVNALNQLMSAMDKLSASPSPAAAPAK